MRLNPCDNDSDGCFVALFCKTAPLPDEASSATSSASCVEAEEEEGTSAVDPASAAAPAATVAVPKTKRGDFSVPVQLRAGAVIVPVQTQPRWPAVCKFLGLDAPSADVVAAGLEFLTATSAQTEELEAAAEAEANAANEEQLGSVFIATRAAAALATSGRLAVLRAGAIVLVPSTARTGAEDAAGDGSTHRLAEGSAAWALRGTNRRVIRLESTAQLAAVGVGELTSVDGLSATAQEALGGMSGGCLAYFVEGHEGDDEQGLGLGAKINVVVFILFLIICRGSLGTDAKKIENRDRFRDPGLECVVGWRTGGTKLMVYVAKPVRQLLKERCAVFAAAARGDGGGSGV